MRFWMPLVICWVVVWLLFVFLLGGYSLWCFERFGEMSRSRGVDILYFSNLAILFIYIS